MALAVLVVVVKAGLGIAGLMVVVLLWLLMLFWPWYLKWRLL